METHFMSAFLAFLALLQCILVQGAGTSHISVTTGSSATLRCVSSHPICEDRDGHGWFRYKGRSFLVISRCDKILVAAAPRVSVSVKSDGYLLTIADSRPEDSGTYVCFSARSWRFSDGLVLDVTSPGVNPPASTGPSSTPASTPRAETLLKSRPPSVIPVVVTSRDRVSDGETMIGNRSTTTANTPTAAVTPMTTIGPTRDLRQDRLLNATLPGYVGRNGDPAVPGKGPGCLRTAARDNETRAGSETMEHPSESSELPVVWIASCAVLLFANAVTALFATRWYRKAKASPLLYGNPTSRREVKTWRPKKVEECRGEPMEADYLKIPEFELHYAELEL